MDRFPSKDKCHYTACYCEENVWMLCDFVKHQAPDDLQSCYVVFISNKIRQIPLWKQKLQKHDEKPVIWDYHVLMVYKTSNGSQVYDLDTTLSFPCAFDDYIWQAVRREETLPEIYQRKFRVIPADIFLATFASDRRHMMLKDGSWKATPPQYPPIQTRDSSHNLEDFITMDVGTGSGEVLTLSQFIHKFS